MDQFGTVRFMENIRGGDESTRSATATSYEALEQVDVYERLHRLTRGSEHVSSTTGDANLGV